MAALTIGVDIGQKVDPTAVAIVERDTRTDPRGEAEVHHLVRFLERLPLGTSYPAIATRLVAVVAGATERTKRRPLLYLDATGVGTPVVDLLRQAGVKAALVPVFFTHGDRRTQERDRISLGKAWLVSRLQSLLQTGRLHAPPQHPEAKVLAKELLDYEIQVDQDANDKYGAFKVGTHDDLVTALGLATQVDTHWWEHKRPPRDLVMKLTLRPERPATW